MKLSILLLFSVFAACSPSMSSQAPEISLVNLTMGKVSIFESDLLISYRVLNVSNKPRNFSGASFKLYINDEYMGKGVSDQEIVIAPLKEAVGSGIIHVSNVNFFTELQPLIKSGKFQYRLEVRLYPSGGISGVYTEDEGGFEFDGKKVNL